MDWLWRWLQSPVGSVCLWGLIAISSKQVNNLMRSVGKLLSAPWERLSEALSELSKQINEMRPAVHRSNKDLANAVRDMLRSVEQALDAAVASLGTHRANLMRILEEDDEKRGWRVVGSLVSLVALVLFVYADLSQAANSVSVLLPEAEVPEPLRDLILPLLMASTGSAAILGLAIGDCMGMTHFTPYGQPRWRWSIFAVSVLTLVAAITFSVFISLERYGQLAVLSADARERIHNGAALAQSLIIIPLLVATVLLFWAWSGLIVIYASFVGISSMFLKWIKFATSILGKAVEWGAVSIDLLVKVLSVILTFAVSSLAVFLGLIGTVLALSFGVAQALFEAISYPPRWLARGVAVLAKLPDRWIHGF